MEKNERDQGSGILLKTITRGTFLKIGGALIAGTGVLAACNQGTSGDGNRGRSEPNQGGAATVAASAPPDAKRVAADPTNVPSPSNHTSPKTHKVDLLCTEVVGEIESGKYFRYLTFNGQVPAPMIRVRQGDTVDLTITNPVDSRFPHSVDFHAIYGTGGGSEATTVGPGQTRRLKVRMLYPGAFIYHCAVPNLDFHISSGMFGLILVEPPRGLRPVDHEFYFGQNEIYIVEDNGDPNQPLQFDFTSMVAETPHYVVLNGESNAITDARYGSLKVKKGETARIFFVNGGPNLISSFHPIGNVWRRAWREGAVANAPEEYLQVVGVSPGSCAVMEMEFPVPETIKLVDHSLSRYVHKGLLAVIDVEGDPEPDIFNPMPA